MFIKKSVLILCLIVIIGVFVSVFFYMQLSRNTTTSYIQLSRNEDQLATNQTVNTNILITLDSQDDKKGKAISWNKNDPGTITINEDGLYFLAASTQGGAKENVLLENDTADIVAWYNLNGHAVPGGAAWAYISKQSRAQNLSGQSVVKFSKGDKLRMFFRTNLVNSGLLHYTPDITQLPGMNSFSFIMFKIKS